MYAYTPRLLQLLTLMVPPKIGVTKWQTVGHPKTPIAPPPPTTSTQEITSQLAAANRRSNQLGARFTVDVFVS